MKARLIITTIILILFALFLWSTVYTHSVLFYHGDGKVTWFEVGWEYVAAACLAALCFACIGAIVWGVYAGFVALGSFLVLGDVKGPKEFIDECADYCRSRSRVKKEAKEVLKRLVSK